MADWIARQMQEMGYIGIALLMFLENLFPPIPSEVIMPMAGMAVANGDLNMAGVIGAGTAGTLVGALFFLRAPHPNPLHGDTLEGDVSRSGKPTAELPSTIPP